MKNYNLYMVIGLDSMLDIDPRLPVGLSRFVYRNEAFVIAETPGKAKSRALLVFNDCEYKGLRCSLIKKGVGRKTLEAFSKFSVSSEFDNFVIGKLLGDKEDKKIVTILNKFDERNKSFYNYL